MLKDLDVTNALSTFNATLSGETSYIFTVLAQEELPRSLSELAVRVDVKALFNEVFWSDKMMSLGKEYTYQFLSSSKNMFIASLKYELEKKQYSEFSKTFDKEVDSELKD